MATSTEFLVLDYTGRALDLVRWSKASYNQALDGIPTFSIEVHPRTPWSLLKRGRWIVPLRQPHGGVLGFNGLFSLQRRKRTLSQSGQETFTIGGQGAKGILAWRVINEIPLTDTSNIYVQKTDLPADLMLTQFLDEHFGARVKDQGRSLLTTWGMQVRPAFGVAPKLTKTAQTGQTLLALCDDIVKTGLSETVPFRLGYDVTLRGINDEFGLDVWTWLDVRGENRGLDSPRPVTLYPLTHCTEVVQEDNGEKEHTLIYVGGRQPDLGPVRETYWDNDRLYAYPGARREKYYNSQRVGGPSIRTEALKFLREGLPDAKTIVALRDSPQLAIGKHLRLGDRVVLAWGRDLVEVDLKTVTYTLDAGQEERVDARFEPNLLI